MATTASNNIHFLEGQTAVQRPVTTNLTVNQGDLVYWDGTNYTFTPVTNKSQIAASPYAGSGVFLGVALQSNADIIYPNDPDQFGVLVGWGYFWFTSTTGDTYGWDTGVTVGATSQTVTSTGATATIGSSYNLVGYAVPVLSGGTARPSQATPAPETVAGPTRLLVRVKPTYLPTAAV
jgi:hypothetical protein